MRLVISFRVLEEENERIGAMADRRRGEAVHDRAHRGVRASILFRRDLGRSLWILGDCIDSLFPLEFHSSSRSTAK